MTIGHHETTPLAGWATFFWAVVEGADNWRTKRRVRPPQLEWREPP